MKVFSITSSNSLPDATSCWSARLALDTTSSSALVGVASAFKLVSNVLRAKANRQLAEHTRISRCWLGRESGRDERVERTRRGRLKNERRSKSKQERRTRVASTRVQSATSIRICVSVCACACDCVSVRACAACERACLCVVCVCVTANATTHDPHKPNGRTDTEQAPRPKRQPAEWDRA